MKTISSIMNQSLPSSRGSAFDVLHHPQAFGIWQPVSAVETTLDDLVSLYRSWLNRAGNANLKLLRHTITDKPLSAVMPSFQWTNFAATCCLCAITYHLPPVPGRWQMERTQGQKVQSITALTSAWTSRTSQKIWMSASLENHLLKHFTSRKWIWWLRNPAITCGWRYFINSLNVTSIIFTKVAETAKGLSAACSPPPYSMLDKILWTR